jgi:hypothetical protein
VADAQQQQQRMEITPERKFFTWNDIRLSRVYYYGPPSTDFLDFLFNRKGFNHRNCLFKKKTANVLNA